jgi:protein TonB
MSLGATLPGATPLGAARASVRPVWLRPLALVCILAVHAALFFTFKGEPQAIEPLDTVDVTLAPMGDSAIDQQQVEENHPSPAPPPPPIPPPPAPAVETPPELAAPPPEIVAPEAAPVPAAPPKVAKPKPVEPAKPSEARQESLRQEKIRQEKIREREERQQAATQREKLREAEERRRNEKEQEARQQARRGVAEGSRSGGMSSATYAALLAGELRRHTFYPAAARAVGATGTVGVVFTVGPSGRVISQSITRSSGNAALDAAAHAIMSAVRTPPPPGGRFSTSTNLRFNFH